MGGGWLTDWLIECSNYLSTKYLIAVPIGDDAVLTIAVVASVNNQMLI